MIWEGESKTIPERRYGSMIFDTPIASVIVISFIWLWDDCGAAGCVAAGVGCGCGCGCGIGDIGAAWRSCDIPSSVDVTFWSHKLLFTGLKLPMGGVIGDELSAKIDKIKSILEHWN